MILSRMKLRRITIGNKKNDKRRMTIRRMTVRRMTKEE
jgi:hypothetical protein